jgi:hypothetical protein
MQNPRAIVLVLLSVAAFVDGVVHQLTAPGEVFARSDARGGIAVGLFLLSCVVYVVLQRAGEYAAYYALQS